MGVGCHFLLQGNPSPGSFYLGIEPRLLHCRWILYWLSHQYMNICKFNFTLYWLVGRKRNYHYKKSEIFLLLTTVIKCSKKHAKRLPDSTQHTIKPLWEISLLLPHRYYGSGVPPSSEIKKGEMIYDFIDHHTKIFVVLIFTKLSWSF